MAAAPPPVYMRPSPEIASLIDAEAIPWFGTSACGRYGLVAGRPDLLTISEVSRDEVSPDHIPRPRPACNCDACLEPEMA